MENLSNKDWSNLPLHKPDADLWNRIDTELDIQGVSGSFSQLPKYSPKTDLWKSISFKLTYYQYLKYFYLTGVGIIATILFFVFTNPSNKSKEVIKSIEKKETIAITTQTENKEVSNLSESDAKNNNIKNTFAVQEKTIPSEKKEIARINHNIIDNKIISEKESIQTIQNYISGKETISQTPNNKKEIVKNEVQTETNILANKAAIIPITLDMETSTTNNPEKSENNNLKQTINKETSVAESIGIEPKKVNLRSTEKPLKKGYSTIGIDYTILKIYIKEAFSYTNNQLINQFGMSYQYNYFNWLIQTGLSYSKYSDNLVNKVHFQKNQYNTFNYVDSVIYNSQGQIIQYITHPVTINDSLLFFENISTSKNYSFLNIPILAGYQWYYGRIKLSLKTGFLLTVIFSEKTTLVLPVIQNIKVLQIEPSSTSISGIKTAGVVSAALSYDFTKRWGLSIEPIVYYYFKPFYNNMDLIPGYEKKSPWLYGVKTGLFYKF